MASSSAPAQVRSCVILATNDYSSHTYTFHHIDAAPFFSRPDPDTQAMDDGINLPPASARGYYLEFHLLLRGCERDAGVKVVSTDAERRTVIYNVARRAVRGGPMMHAPKDSPVSLAVGDGMFVFERRPASGHRRFEALRYDPLREDWFWYGIPMPPYVRDPGYRRSSITALTPAAGGRIWTTTEGVGTYSFDTRRRSWRKEGDWALPFLGQAEHVPGRGDGLSFEFLAVECNGYTSPNGPLCAVDLATATADSPPVVRGVWEEFKPPGEWTPSTPSLVHLGSGKMCVFRFFQTDRTGGSRNRRVVVITAVEVSAHDGEIKMVKHRSKSIRFQEHLGHITWIL
ncbi:hypothetical protein QYE76_019895 [Lolium multiflorum]|uniref:Uncharacterized protein n=1 Tax=Lolium multiflorum TaxID=4521 RepID=A0AAD8R3U7_LOLMU|nr:hypothetical protein QYE76_019895 [Lolium multiflorum]